MLPVEYISELIKQFFRNKWSSSDFSRKTTDSVYCW
jgi:hypothetical protein